MEGRRREYYKLFNHELSPMHSDGKKVPERISKVLRYIPCDGKKILDVGCADGMFSSFYKRELNIV